MCVLWNKINDFFFSNKRVCMYFMFTFLSCYFWSIPIHGDHVHKRNKILFIHIYLCNCKSELSYCKGIRLYTLFLCIIYIFAGIEVFFSIIFYKVLTMARNKIPWDFQTGLKLN